MSMVPNPNQLDATTKEVAGYGIGYFGYNLGAAGIMTYLTFFYTDHMLIPAASVSLILLVSRLLDAFTDLLVGVLMDKTTSKLGKARPWLLWMALPAAISMTLLYYVPNFSVQGRVIYAFVTYNLVAFFYLTCMALPMQVLVSLLTPNPQSRITVNTWGGVGTVLGAVFVNFYAQQIMDGLGGGAVGMWRFFTIVGFIGAALMVVCVLLTKEKAEKKQMAKVPLGPGLKAILTNRYWWNITGIQLVTSLVPAMWGATVYYAKFILNQPAIAGPIMSLMWGGMLVGIFAFLPIAKKFGKKNAVFISMSLQVLGSVVLYFAPTSIAMVWFSTFLRAVGPGPITSLSNAMRADVVEHVEWKSGLRAEGMIYSGASFGMKVGSGLGGSLLAAILAWGGYVGGAAVQSAAAISAIKTAFIIVPCIGSCLIMLMLSFFDIEKHMPQITADLKARREAEDAGIGA